MAVVSEGNGGIPSLAYLTTASMK
uniref:Uncharacterized protein n=1 Tax=Anguilla anguilla TaxID=7936 RepID=A0A0E9PRF9_ANGAN